MGNPAYHWSKLALASAGWTLCGPTWGSGRGRAIYFEGVLGAQDKAYAGGTRLRTRLGTRLSVYRRKNLEFMSI